jgi:PqqD family protein of HPr-rel-A system
MHDTAAPVYRVSGDVNLLWRQWDDEYIVFDAVSGDTHLLNEVAAEVLRTLSQHPCNALQLTHQVASRLRLESITEFPQNIEKLLGHLEALGLIQPIVQ